VRREARAGPGCSSAGRRRRGWSVLVHDSEPIYGEERKKRDMREQMRREEEPVRAVIGGLP